MLDDHSRAALDSARAAYEQRMVSPSTEKRPLVLSCARLHSRAAGPRSAADLRRSLARAFLAELLSDARLACAARCCDQRPHASAMRR